MKVVLTGGSGFVGRNLVSYLSDYKTLQISRKELNGDFSTLFKDCEVFIHLAGKAHDLKKTSDADEYYKVNFELTKNLFDAF